MSSFNAVPLEQRVYGVDVSADNRVLEFIKNAENEAVGYFRKFKEAGQKIKNTIYLIKDLPTYCKRGVEKTKDGYRRYIKPIYKIMGLYIDGRGDNPNTIILDPVIFDENHILRKGGYLPDNNLSDDIYVHGTVKIEDPTSIIGHEDMHGGLEEIGTYEDPPMKEGLTQLVTESRFPDAEKAYPLETEAMRRTVKEYGLSNVFHPNDVSPSKRRRIVNTFQRHYNNLKRRLH